MQVPRRILSIVVVAVAAAGLGFGVANAVEPTPSSPNAHSQLTQSKPTARQLKSVSNGTVESTYVPLTNCRVVNTSLAGGKIPNGATRNFFVSGTTGFPGQGGQSGGCKVPTWATAVSARLTAFGATGNGAFSAFPTGKPIGQGTLYYAKGVSVTTGATLQLGTGGRVSVRNTAGPAVTTIDVNGYYAQQIHAVLAPAGGIDASNSNRVLSNTRSSTGKYAVTIAGSLTGCTPIASVNGGAYIASAVIAGNTVYADTYALSGNPVNLYWTLVVMC